MIKMNLKGCNSKLSKGEFERLAAATEGYSNADLKNVTGVNTNSKPVKSLKNNFENPQASE